MSFDISLYASEIQFRTQVLAALNSLAAGTALADNSIALSKLVQIPTGKILGNESGVTGNVTTVTYP